MNFTLDQQIEQVLRRYFGETNLAVEKKESGVNNTTRFVAVDGQRYVLRLYDNHAEPEKLVFEAEVLTRLQAARLSFGIPQVVAALDGATWAQAADGRLAVLFRYIEGERASFRGPTEPETLGAATGQLVRSLGQLDFAQPPAYEPYYEVYRIHPLVTRAALHAWLDEADARAASAEAADLLRKELLRLESRLPELTKLPRQLVHSDIVYGNVLIASGKVCGILDFEFVTVDLRAMELAVLLCELLVRAAEHPGDARTIWKPDGGLAACLKGYGRHAGLTREERQALPQLIVLRRLTLVPHFLGRYMAGVDEEEPVRYLLGFADIYGAVQANEATLQQWLSDYVPLEEST